jgi:hypothetical protein
VAGGFWLGWEEEPVFEVPEPAWALDALDPAAGLLVELGAACLTVAACGDGPWAREPAAGLLVEPGARCPTVAVACGDGLWALGTKPAEPSCPWKAAAVPRLPSVEPE